MAPVVFRRREFREGSGGAGRFRGGLGQVIELGGAEGTPIAMLCNFERVNNPARGRDGGRPGAAGTVTLRSGRPIRPKGRQTVPPATSSASNCRAAAASAIRARAIRSACCDDVLDGLITVDDARRDYGVAIDADLQLNLAETQRLRAEA